MNNEIAKVYDNRIERKALMLDTARPFVVIAPRSWNAVIGHYATKESAKRAAKKFNERVNQ